MGNGKLPLPQAAPVSQLQLNPGDKYMILRVPAGTTDLVTLVDHESTNLDKLAMLIGGLQALYCRWMAEQVAGGEHRIVPPFAGPRQL